MRLRDIQNHQGEYARITRMCILTPDAFFSGMKGEGRRYLKPIVYMIVSQALFMAGSSLAYFFMEPFLYFRMSMQTLFFLLIFFMISGIFLVVLITLTGRMAGGNGSFNDSIKVICYSYSVLNFAWLFFVSFNFVDRFFLRNFGPTAVILIAIFILLGVDVIQYTVYIIVTGISVTAGITKLRALAVFLASVIITAVLLIGGTYLLDTSSQQMQTRQIQPPDQTPSPPPTQPPGQHDVVRYQGLQRVKIIAFLGSAPIIDGIISDDDRWTQGWRTEVGVGGNFTITSKHDKENLYLLLEGRAPVEQKKMISIYLEQDDGDPDFNLSTGRIDWYYQVDGTDPSVFGDGHYVPGTGYSKAEHLDGSLKTSYSVNKSEWIMEWKIPLNSGDKDDIFVNQYPSHLGFSIINEKNGEEGILPFYADKNDSWTWAELWIADEKLRN